MYCGRAALLIPLLSTILLPLVIGGDVSLNLRDAKKPITHLYLDFEQTITVDTFPERIRDIFCVYEVYPNCNCSRLPNGKCNGTDERSLNEVAASLQKLPEGGKVNLTNSLGGEQRLKRIRSWLERLRKGLKGNVYIVSTVWYPLASLQWQVFLKKVSDLLTLGFDSNHIKTLADPGPGIPADKGKVIKANMKENDVAFECALFVDDSGGNIKTAQDVCNTLYLYRKNGMDDTDMDYIETLANGCCNWVNSSPRMVQDQFAEYDNFEEDLPRAHQI